jgi:hypothetical protein
MLNPATFWRNGREHALNASADRKTTRNSPAHSRSMADYLPLAEIEQHLDPAEGTPFG